MQVRPRRIIRWKVVEKFHDRMYSAIAPPCVRVEYRKGRWTTAKIGGLLVFRTFKDAYCYGRCIGDAIYRCECKERTLLPKDSLNLCDISVLRTRALWQGVEGMSRYILDSWPQGTQAFRKVKLLEEVEA